VLEQQPGVHLIARALIGAYFVTFNMGNKHGVGTLPYSNVGTPMSSSPKLRQAFEQAIDRPALVKAGFGGQGEPGCAPIPVSDTEWYDPDVKCTPYDPQGAKALVAASGVSSPAVNLLVPTSVPSGAQLAQVIQAEEAAVGINVTIQTTDGPTGIAEMLSGNWDAALTNSIVPGDPDSIFYSTFATSGSANTLGYSNPRLDFVLANSRKATTLAARRTLFDTASQILLADRPRIWLFYPEAYVGVSTSVSGVEFAPDGHMVVAFARYN
jgi:ABC-type transport system substrate-binding protein